jgi:hypothetical protein
VLTNICLITSAQANLQASQRVCRQHPRCRSVELRVSRFRTYVELRGLEPLTSSMPWPGVRKGQAAGDDGVRGRVGAATFIQPGAPQFAPHPSNGDRGDPAPTCSAWEDIPRASCGSRWAKACNALAL